ncbi:MAG: hypothetical protein Ct9H300mP20_07210 [Gammaproteobacteria bacterium]|nr:MAG: hypothetical protein Ct9H300mP20_07210 [Gammaproteobacteria bacterium]
MVLELHPFPYAGAYVMAPIALTLGGSDSQKENWLPKIAGGEVVIGIGLSEYVGPREDAAITPQVNHLWTLPFCYGWKKMRCLHSR